MPEQLPPDLERVADLVRRAAPSSEAPPQGLRDETIAAIERQRELDGSASRAARSRPARGRRSLVPRLLPALAAAAAVVLAVVVLGGGDEAPEGELEVRAQLVGDGSRATAEVREIGIGRTITFRSDSLPILPKGEFYELWFVGPGDRPGRPNRISAGTFHPDPEGRSDVDFTAAVDPAKYPRLSVTAEPGDGDPRPSRREVLSSGR
jgi:anti-sigma-K factor RskA